MFITRPSHPEGENCSNHIQLMKSVETPNPETQQSQGHENLSRRACCFKSHRFHPEVSEHVRTTKTTTTTRRRRRSPSRSPRPRPSRPPWTRTVKAMPAPRGRIRNNSSGLLFSDWQAPNYSDVDAGFSSKSRSRLEERSLQRGMAPSKCAPKSEMKKSKHLEMKTC